MAETIILDPRASDITGQTFGALTVIRPTAERLRTYVVWECRCECGTILKASAKTLKEGHRTSCGCKPRAHGANREYRIWTDMRTRCNNKNNKRYKRYGGRGIRVCERWNSFANFMADMGPCPDGLTLDRKNNDGPYEPDNCRWAGYHEQHVNMSRNRRLTFNGRTLCMSEWAIETGIDQDTIHARLTVLGWSIDRALTEPVQMGRRPKPK